MASIKMFESKNLIDDCLEIYKPIKNYPEYMIREILNLITKTTTQAPETVLNEADIESPDPDTVVINVDEGG
jgi:hypothetical protein